MSCYACTRKYGLFCKEFGCANCGYSFCLKCLKNEIEVPRRNNQKQKVCLRCFAKLKEATDATSSSNTGKLEPNEIFQITDSPASLDPVLQPISLTATTSAPLDDSNSQEIAENLDSEILNRLHSLKAGDALPGEDELRMRLCNLQGFQPKEYSKKDILLSTDERSEQEKINDLLKQFVEESDIDTKVSNNDPISEIESRLAALRGSDMNEVRKQPVAELNTPSDNEEDNETMLKDIIQRYIAEAHLPSARGSDLLSDGLTPSTSQAAKAEELEELPFCTVCNEDATIRCDGCGGDLFCRPCFKECHDDDEEWRRHITKPYKNTTQHSNETATISTKTRGKAGVSLAWASGCLPSRGNKEPFITTRHAAWTIQKVLNDAVMKGTSTQPRISSPAKKRTRDILQEAIQITFDESDF